VVVKWVTATSPLPQTSDVGPLRPEMVVIPAGKYTIGGDEKAFRSLPLPEAELDAFALSTTEVTRQQYALVMGEDPSGDKDCGAACPVTDVTWLDAVKYMNRLSEVDPKVEPCYQIEGEDVSWVEDCLGYRLPMEAEWEAAARAGTRDGFAGTDEEGEVCRYGNVADQTYRRENPDSPFGFFDCDDGVAGLAPVASFLANGFGLYDMTGNVWEWVWDPTSSGRRRVFRGGSFGGHPQGARVAFRGVGGPSIRIPSLGFRVARSLPSSL
jgi:formylglycine-generating enzyme required for sulfatase activity